MRNNSELLSREALMGYDPQTIHDMSVLLVGGGAIGSSFAQAAALVGVGSLYIVDPDVFEESNLTRSPLVTASDVGCSKAEVLAARARGISTNPKIVTRCSVAKIEELGYAAFEGVTCVMGAVDSLRCRMWLGERTARLGIPFTATCGRLGITVVRRSCGEQLRVDLQPRWLKPKPACSPQEPTAQRPRAAKLECCAAPKEQLYSALNSIFGV